MRRIIERVVTVVTTTTWKISWEPDTPPASRDHQADLVPNEFSSSDVVIQPQPTVIEVKEVHPSQPESETDPKADEPSIESYPEKTERKSKS